MHLPDFSCLWCLIRTPWSDIPLKQLGGLQAEVFKGKGNNKGYGSKGTKRKAVDPADAAGGKGDQASAKESLLPGDFLEMIAQAKREKEENEEIDRLRKEVEQQEGEASIAAAKNSLSDNKKRQPSAKPQSAQKQSRCAASCRHLLDWFQSTTSFFFRQILLPTCHRYAPTWASFAVPPVSTQVTMEIIVDWLQP
jgi:hypothetical protein